MLGLVLNAGVLCTTRYTDAAVAQLRAGRSGRGRPFLGGSPRQIAEDHLCAGQGLGLDEGLQAADVDGWPSLRTQIA